MQRINNLLRLGLCLLCISAPNVLAQARIVSTDAAVTQIVFALGVDTDLAAIDVTSTLPPGYRELPVVGYHRALAAEGLLALNPSLVIGSQHIGPPKVLASLASAGIPVLQLPGAHTIAELKDNIEQIAAATGAESRAEVALAELDKQTVQLSASALHTERVAFVLAVEPGKMRIAGNGTAGEAFIKLLGAKNIADFDAYRTLSAEAILDLAPTVILVAAREGASAEQVLEMNAILQYGQAARSGRIVQVNAANLTAGLSPEAVAEAVAIAESLKHMPEL